MTSEQTTARTNSSDQTGKSPSSDFIIASWNTKSSIPSKIAAMPCGVRLAGVSAVVAIVLKPDSSLPCFGAAQRALWPLLVLDFPASTKLNISIDPIEQSRCPRIGAA